MSLGSVPPPVTMCAHNLLALCSKSSFPSCLVVLLHLSLVFLKLLVDHFQGSEKISQEQDQKCQCQHENLHRNTKNMWSSREKKINLCIRKRSELAQMSEGWTDSYLPFFTVLVSRQAKQGNRVVQLPKLWESRHAVFHNTAVQLTFVPIFLQSLHPPLKTLCNSLAFENKQLTVHAGVKLSCMHRLVQ